MPSAKRRKTQVKTSPKKKKSKQEKNKSFLAEITENLLVSFGMIILLLISLSLTEMVVRYAHVQREGKEAFQLRWMKLAGAVGVFSPEEGIINSLGFHSREIPVLKEKNTYRVIVLGGSAVYGWDKPESSWVWYLEKRLKERLPGKNIEVINAGIPGGTTIEELKLLREIVALNPDAVIAYDGWNDIYYSHYCSEWWWKRYKDHSYSSRTEELISDINRWLEYHSYVFLSVKKSFFKWRKSLRHQQQEPLPAVSEGRPAKADSGKIFDLDKTDLPPGMARVQCKDSRLYTLNPEGSVEDNFSSVYEEDVLRMEHFLRSKGIPFILILQPSLTYSESLGAVSKEIISQNAIIKGIFHEDWRNACSVLYPKAQALIKKLKGRGILAYDFTSLFEGKNAIFFADCVHIKDPQGLDMIARETEEILVENGLLPSSDSSLR